MESKDKRQILILDDEYHLAQSTAIVLKMKGYKCDIALDVDEGLELIKSKEYQLILLDIMLPGKDGWRFLEQLRKDNKNKHIAVIAFTAKEYLNIEKLVKEKGLQGFLAKPFEPSELLAIIRKVLK